MISALGDALRIAFWRAPRAVNGPSSPASILLIYLTVVVVGVGCQFLQADADLREFQLYGINSTITCLAVSAGIAVCFGSIGKSLATLRSLALLQACGLLLAVGVASLTESLPDTVTPFLKARGASASIVTTIISVIGLGVLVAMAAWFTAAARMIFKSVPQVRRPTLRALALTGCTAFASIVLPYWPVFTPPDFKRESVNLWESGLAALRASKNSDSREDPEAYKATRQKISQIESKQSTLVRTALNAVPPRDAARSNIFMLGVSGYSDQDVFAHESEQSADILKSRFAIGDRVVQLINDEGSTATQPLASIQNLGHVLHELGARMDARKDVLILTMTSHGSRDGFVLQFRNSFYRELYPQVLKSMLDEAGIKNRILIISACYSGIFVPELADENTVIMTAASATRMSFGCANGRQWTYFGDALFAHGLKEKTTLSEAFVIARETVGTWESEQNLKPSDPQISVGGSIARRFPTLVGPVPAQTRRQSEEEHAFDGTAPLERGEQIAVGSQQTPIR